MKQKIQYWWFGLSQRTRDHIISAVKVFAAAFLTTVLFTLKTGIAWDWAFWATVVTTGLNNAIKALIENYAPPSLGGIRKL